MPCTDLQKVLQAWMPRILKHPFNQKLANGTLPINTFNRFLVYDKKYLQAYAAALKTISNRLKEIDLTDAETFHYFSYEARNTEHYLHQKYLKQAESPRFFRTPPPSENPSMSTYVQHLHLNTQTKPIPVAIAAVLPCFMIYRELGMHMPTQPEHRFYDWIKTYSSSAFLENTEKMIAIFNAHDQLDLHDQTLESFNASIQHEINFWDSVYNVGGLRGEKHAANPPYDTHRHRQ